MRFCYALISSLVFASVVIARRTRELNNPTSSASSDVEYNQFWSGAHYKNSDETFSFVTATFEVPTVTGLSDSGGSMAVSINDNGCSGSIILAGIDYSVNNGETTYGAFAFRDLDPLSTSGITVSPGDHIKTTITTLTSTSAAVDFDNLTRKQHIYGYLNSTDGSELCGEEVMWALRRRTDGTSINVDPPQFGTATFVSASARGSSGTIEPSGATLVDMKQGNIQLTSVSADGSSMSVVRL